MTDTDLFTADGKVEYVGQVVLAVAADSLETALKLADGIALGVQGTPTFFLDGEMLTLTSLEQFRAEVDAAASN